MHGERQVGKAPELGMGFVSEVEESFRRKKKNED